MGLVEYTALQRHWEKHPRLEWLVAGFCGYKPKEASSVPQKEETGGFSDFLTFVGADVNSKETRF